MTMTLKEFIEQFDKPKSIALLEGKKSVFQGLVLKMQEHLT